MRFHILHSISNGKIHTFSGFDEVIETLMWGLRQLGHTVEYAVNQADLQARNIVFGSHMMPVAWQETLPRDSIVYNLEQVRGFGKAREEAFYANSNFQIWEYSPFNMAFWTTQETRYPPKLVPICHAPPLERIESVAEQEIDVLIYGMPNKERIVLFDELAHAGLSTVFLSGLYGKGRDALIARSKVIANVSFFTQSKVFEVVRASYLMSNHKAVAAAVDSETAIEADIRDGIAAVSREMLVPTIARLVDDRDARVALERRGYERMTRRDIRPVLESVLKD